MKTLSIHKKLTGNPIAHLVYGLVATLLLWYLVPELIYHYNETAGVIDSSIWLLLMFSIISFGLLLLLCVLLFRYFIGKLGLPKTHTIVSQFKTLTTCQQFAFYWASFALLLLAAVLSLVAVF